MALIDIKEIEELIDKLCFSSTKADGEPFKRRLKFIHSTMDANGYTKEKLIHAISHASEASGQVDHKDQQRSHAMQQLYLFKKEVAESLED